MQNFWVISAVGAEEGRALIVICNWFIKAWNVWFNITSKSSEPLHHLMSVPVIGVGEMPHSNAVMSSPLSGHPM
jgi:hypothetical protein